MSGIAGRFNRPGEPVARTDLNRMLEAMRKRGPDAAVAFSAKNVGLGHAMLRTTPSSVREVQPLMSPEHELAVVADARLDNRKTLVRSLYESKHSENDLTDAQIIMMAYQRWGLDCVQHLLGDFAFAIWDGIKGRLLLARDHFGVRPLYYTKLSSGGLAFASDVKALISLPDASRRMDGSRVLDFLVPGLESLQPNATFYASCKKLSPAHILVATERSTDIHAYWNLSSLIGEVARKEDWLDAFRQTFAECVRARLDTIQPAAVMLSGGIDSAAVAAFAKEARAQVWCVSALNPTTSRCTETQGARRVVHKTGLPFAYTTAESLDALGKEFSELPRQADDLFDVFMTLPQAAMAIARNQGARVVLDGVDGDMVTSSPVSYIAHLMRTRHFGWAVDEALGYSRFSRGFYSPLQLLAQNAWMAFVPRPFRVFRQVLKSGPAYSEILKNSFVRRTFAQRFGLKRKMRAMRERDWKTASIEPRAAHLRLLQMPYIRVAVDRYERVASHFGLESRHPFLDLRLVRLCLNAPWHTKVAHGWTKMLLRRATDGMIPEDIQWTTRHEHLGWRFTRARIRQENELILEAFRHRKELLPFMEIDRMALAWNPSSGGRECDNPGPFWRTAMLHQWLKRNKASGDSCLHVANNLDSI